MRSILCSLLLSLLPLSVLGETTEGLYRAYVERYKAMAIDQMKRYRIPASITLAQGLLESGAGRSTLATEANNHFGVKCGGRWSGPYVVRDDDARGEHFRKYRNAKDSYEDHSKFLLQRRYASLFTLSLTDYKGWARGLKRCGYATNPVYAESLISIIERYQLFQYDRPGHRLSFKDRTDVLRRNDNYYIVVREGQTLTQIAKQWGVKRKKLLKYNELPKGYEVGAGDIIYFEKKQSKAEKKYKGKYHVLRRGESLYDVAQLYGVRLKSLYKAADLRADYVPREGDRLRIR